MITPVSMIGPAGKGAVIAAGVVGLLFLLVLATQKPAPVPAQPSNRW